MNKKRRISWNELSSIRNMKAAGMTNMQIADVLGRSEFSVITTFYKFQACATEEDFRAMHKNLGRPNRMSVKNGTVAKYILSHEESTLKEVAAACGVPLSTVKLVYESL